MTTYAKCSDVEHKFLKQIIKDHYPDIKKCEVTFDLIYAYAEKDKDGNPNGPALKLHGYSCAAIIKHTKLIERVCGRRDVLIQLDGDIWEDFTIQEKTALLDHELYHIELKETSPGVFETDGVGRPLIKMRNHDFQIGGFHEIIKRNGRAALEAQNLGQAADPHGQLTFNFDKKPKDSKAAA